MFLKCLHDKSLDGICEALIFHVILESAPLPGVVKRTPRSRRGK